MKAGQRRHHVRDVAEENNGHSASHFGPITQTRQYILVPLHKHASKVLKHLSRTKLFASSNVETTFAQSSRISNGRPQLARAVRYRWPPVALIVTSGQTDISDAELPSGGRDVET
jgi:hypothetical protein